MTTAAERAAVYRKIFENLPVSFLDPEAQSNQHLIGAIALAVAHTENLYRTFEAGLFIDSSSLTDGASSPDGNGLSSLDRWGVWLQLPRLSGETAEEYRLRLQARMYSPRVTRRAIREALERVTGLDVEIQETADRVLRFNEGAWAAKKIMGNHYAYMAIDLVTHGATNAVPSVMQYLRAAGVRWRHIETVVHELVIGWDTKQTSTQQLAWDWTQWFTNGARPGHGYPSQLWAGASTWDVSRSDGLMARTDWGGGATLYNGATVEAHFYPTGTPVLIWDNSLSIWGESAWGA